MKIMIFGDSGAGKSTFAKKLGGKLSLPVLHLDEVMDKLGRKDKQAIGEYIQKETQKAKWIIDGNAFTKDTHARIKAADLVIVFDINRFKAFYSHIKRYAAIKLSRQSRVGSQDTTLNLSYFIPYIFWQFPGRKKAAIERAAEHNKKIVFVKSHRQADALLKDWGL
jgi:adenylate kinase family enzyme